MRVKPSEAHNATYFYMFFFINFFFAFILSFTVFNSIPEKLNKPKKANSINCEHRKASEKKQEERKIQLSKHTTSYHIWIVQCPIYWMFIFYDYVWVWVCNMCRRYRSFSGHIPFFSCVCEVSVWSLAVW